MKMAPFIISYIEHWSTGGNLVQQRGTVLAILAKGIARNISVKLF